jgi:large subunit ribosomal protein L4
MQLPVIDSTGAALDPIEVDDAVFGIEPNEAVVHQTLVAQLAARRAGSASTRTRGQVRGSTRKLRRQKGLGMARVGSSRSPLRRGGGVAFGPSPRSYAQRLPKRMRRLGLRSVFSSRVAEERLTVIDAIEAETPSTKQLLALLEATGVGQNTLVIPAEADRNLMLSLRNIPGTGMLPADTLSVADLLAYHRLLLTVDAVRRIEELWGGDRASGRTRAAATEMAEA